MDQPLTDYKIPSLVADLLPSSFPGLDDILETMFAFLDDCHYSASHALGLLSSACARWKNNCSTQVVLASERARS